MLAVLLAHLVNGDDVRVNQVGRHGFTLRPKTAREGLAGQRERLHGDNLITADLARFVNHSLVAVGEFLQDFIIAKGTQRRFGLGRARRWDRLTDCGAAFTQSKYRQASGTNPVQNAHGHYGAAFRACLRFDHDPLLSRSIRR